MEREGKYNKKTINHKYYFLIW